MQRPTRPPRKTTLTFGSSTLSSLFRIFLRVRGSLRAPPWPRPKTQHPFPPGQMAQPGVWTISAPNTVDGFSAVCYLTATRISDHLGGSVALGLVDTAVGGTAAQLWLPPRHASACASFMKLESWVPPWTLSCWWNGMASPFTSHDIAFFLWDQVRCPANTSLPQQPQPSRAR